MHILTIEVKIHVNILDSVKENAYRINSEVAIAFTKLIAT